MATDQFVQIVAKPTRFPDGINIEYHSLDENEIPTGEQSSDSRTFSWNQAKIEFKVDADHAEKCESLLREGKTAVLGNERRIIKDYY